MTPSQFLVALLSAILFMNSAAVLAAPLVLFEDIHFRGVRTEVAIERNNTEACVNIRGKLNDFFSSAAAAGDGGEVDCYLLCSDEHCRGRCVPLRGVSVADLSTLGLNDAASSVKRCPPQLNSTTTSLTEEERSPLNSK